MSGERNPGPRPGVVRFPASLPQRVLLDVRLLALRHGAGLAVAGRARVLLAVLVRPPVLVPLDRGRRLLEIALVDPEFDRVGDRAAETGRQGFADHPAL